MRETGLQSFEGCFSLFEWECLGVIYVRVSERKAIKKWWTQHKFKICCVKMDLLMFCDQSAVRTSVLDFSELCQL